MVFLEIAGPPNLFAYSILHQMILGAVPFGFYLYTLQRTLSGIAPERRLMPPARVWLSLIPGFGFFWQFIIVARLADSLRAELKSRGLTPELTGPEPQELTTDRPNLQAKGLTPERTKLQEQGITPDRHRPGYGIGLAYSVLFSVSAIPYIGFPFSPAALICWIIYWSRISCYRRILDGSLVRTMNNNH